MTPTFKEEPIKSRAHPQCIWGQIFIVAEWCCLFLYAIKKHSFKLAAADAWKVITHTHQVFLLSLITFTGKHATPTTAHPNMNSLSLCSHLFIIQLMNSSSIIALNCITCVYGISSLLFECDWLVLCCLAAGLDKVSLFFIWVIMKFCVIFHLIMCTRYSVGSAIHLSKK